MPGLFANLPHNLKKLINSFIYFCDTSVSLTAAHSTYDESSPATLNLPHVRATVTLPSVTEDLRAQSP